MLQSDTASRPFLSRLFRRNEAALALCLILLIAVFGALSDSFLTTRNLTNVLGQAALPLIAAVGLALVACRARSTSPSARFWARSRCR